ncbi:MAG: sigma-70 family RNA polymerase sigma factor [Niameybacter sp.]|uniref:sigma-70 family RNA polymerase sigma factor n=1 Tax=Niameybacter sp. TaxID=2033640 RepID=UPI002FC61F5E
MEETIEQLVLKSKTNPIYTYPLWKKFEPLYSHWAKKLNPIDGTKEDLYQESYLILVKAVQNYKPEQKVKFESYYKLMLYRWGRDYYRKRKEVVIQEEESMDFWSQVPDEAEGIEAQMLRQERLEKLEKALHTLSAEEQNLLLAFYGQRESLKSLAEQQGLSYKALASRKTYALKKLEKFFKAF